MTKANPSTSNEEVIKSRHVVVNIQFCSDLRSIFTVRKMPPVPSNVGSVDSIVIQDSKGNKKFIFEGSALKDSDGNLILTVKPKEGIMADPLAIKAEPLAFIADLLAFMQNPLGQKQWKAFLSGDLEPLFTLKYSGPKNSIEVSLTNSKRCDYEIEKGSLEKDKFTIFDMSGATPRIAAEVTLNNLFRDDNEIIKIKSTYNVKVEPGYDQAFIFGLVAVHEQLRPSNIH